MKKKLWLSQDSYVEKIAASFHMDDQSWCEADGVTIVV